MVRVTEQLPEASHAGFVDFSGYITPKSFQEKASLPDRLDVFWHHAVMAPEKVSDSTA